MEEKLLELNKRIDGLETRIKELENINKKNKIKKIIYYSILGVGSIVVIVAAYFIFKNTYGEIMKYFN